MESSIMSIPENGHVDLHDEQVRRDLGRVVLELLNRWGLSASEQVELLGLQDEGPNAIDQLSRGELVLPDSPVMLTRVGNLLAIHKGLRLLFPENEDIRFGWVRMCNSRLDGEAPLTIMLRDGVEGLLRIRGIVDASLSV